MELEVMARITVELFDINSATMTLTLELRTWVLRHAVSSSCAKTRFGHSVAELWFGQTKSEGRTHARTKALSRIHQAAIVATKSSSLQVGSTTKNPKSKHEVALTYSDLNWCKGSL